MPARHIAVIGGGIMGISLGYFLSRAGHQVEVFEASASLGGLAGPINLPDGVKVDRFYHAILSSDSHLRELVNELGIAGKLKFRETKTGFYHSGRIYPMNGVLDFLRFPPLRWIDRFRLGLTILAAQAVRDWQEMERVGVEDWLVKWGGQRAFDHLWRPMLNAKFDGSFEQTPATYIWSRLVRMKSTRKGAAQKEMAGYLVGGYLSLIEAMRASIERSGGKVHLQAPINEVLVEGGKFAGLRISKEIQHFDAAVVTLQAPLFSRLIQKDGPEIESYCRSLSKAQYLGIIAPLLVLDRPLTGNWTLNITDVRIPFTGVIETTAYIDPQDVGGHHLVYLPKYTAPGSPLQTLSNEEIQEMWLVELEKMFPDFDRGWIRYFLVHREKLVEPVHKLGTNDEMLTVETPISNLFLSTTSQIYPDLTNGESVTRHARTSAEKVINQLMAGVGHQDPRSAQVSVVSQGKIGK
jgi:protoporphyrinogen oxidase